MCEDLCSFPTPNSGILLKQDYYEFYTSNSSSLA
uniref:Uncharacterized protein n=1 Tax=Rhizophora mucronata TaxID=61149 RepID=A0A2P2NHJ6_RHIMU